VILANPPFGGKERKEVAGRNFEIKNRRDGPSSSSSISSPYFAGRAARAGLSFIKNQPSSPTPTIGRA